MGLLGEDPSEMKYLPMEGKVIFHFNISNIQETIDMLLLQLKLGKDP